MTKNKEQRTKSKAFKIRLKKGDMVMVRSGKYKGQTGQVLKVHPSLNKVTVEGVNVFQKQIKPSRQNLAGGAVKITKPIWASKVGIVDSGAKKPARIGYQLKGDKKLRIFKSSGKEIKS